MLAFLIGLLIIVFFGTAACIWMWGLSDLFDMVRERKWKQVRSLGIYCAVSSAISWAILALVFGGSTLDWLIFTLGFALISLPPVAPQVKKHYAELERARRTC